MLIASKYTGFRPSTSLALKDSSEEGFPSRIAESRMFIVNFGERGRNRTFNLLIKSHPRSVGLNFASHI